jgi:DNA-binding transcriptional MerR regulator
VFVGQRCTVVDRDEPHPTEVSTIEAGTTEAGTTEGNGEVFTIDQLAALSGVPSRTIRYYQSKGTLPAPERRGRVALYRGEHVERLKVIAELQDRGLRLDTIREVLAQIEKGGDSLQDWLGMGDQLQAPWSDDHPIVVSETELLERIGSRPGFIAELRGLGVIERQGNSWPATYIVPSPALLDIGVELDAHGVDAVIAFEAGDIMRRRIARMSDELVGFFSDRTGEGFAGRGEPDELSRAFGALRDQGTRVVQVIFTQEIERALREFVERGGAIPAGHRSRSGEGRSTRRVGRKIDRRTDRRGARGRSDPSDGSSS